MTDETILEYRIGNYVNFRGLGVPNEFCFIEAIDQNSANGAIYRLMNTKHNTPFVGRIGDLMSIRLEDRHLEKLGFIINPQTNIYSLVTLDISYHFDIQTNESGAHSLVLPIARIFKPFTRVPQQKEEVTRDIILANTVDLPTVHSFQNYCSDRGLTLDFSLLT